MNRKHQWLGGFTLALACCFVAAHAEPNLGDSPKGLAKRSARWWQWALSIPAANNPLLDRTGANCGVGQPRDYWFLGGTWGIREPVVRNCTIPHGVPVFFPVVNSFWVTIPDCGDNPAIPADYWRTGVAQSIDGATGLEVLLDNRKVPNLRRVQSEVFSAVFPAGNLFAGFGCVVVGKSYSPGVDDGYYVTLHGLSEGAHTLSIRGNTAGSDITGTSPASIDVFYNLIVVK